MVKDGAYKGTLLLAARLVVTRWRSGIFISVMKQCCGLSLILLRVPA